MSKITQKASKIKDSLNRLSRNISGYRRQVVMVEDFVTEETFSVVLYVAKNSGLPALKIVFPTEFGDSEGIGYMESVTLLKDNRGRWTKNVSIEFDKKAKKTTGAKGLVEEVELGSRDIIVIAQIEEMLHNYTAELKLRRITA